MVSFEDMMQIILSKEFKINVQVNEFNLVKRYIVELEHPFHGSRQFWSSDFRESFINAFDYVTYLNID